MSATDELRCMLDERGIEHYDHDHSDVRVTEWDNGGRRDVRYEEWSSGTVRLDASNVTAEQAIDATMGRETCRNVISEGDFVCSGCGAFVHARNANVGKSHVDEDGVRWYGTSYEHNFNYCPNCGARIEVD